MKDITIKGNTIIFKSKPEHWIKEHSGLKPNTVQYLDVVEWDGYNKANIQYISIVHAENGHTFHRKIQDMTCAIVGERPVFIFSWDHSTFVENDSVTCVKKNTTVMRDVNNIIA